MEPITHLMTGACLARAGFNRKAAYATVAMTLAAEMPDLDTLWSVGGPVAGFQHHRGITHTFLLLPLEGLVLVGAIWLVHRQRVRRLAASAPAPAAAALHPTDQPRLRQLTPAPVRWGLLYGFVLIALVSHILLDWTNNYGVRPFFPFNPHWYAGSFVFVFEPVLFVLLLVCLVAPSLFGLIGSEVGARRPVFRGRGWAIAALVGMAVLWGWRWVEHDDAIRLASTATYGPADAQGVEILRVTANPHPGNPFAWSTVVETSGFYQRATVDTLHSTLETDPAQDLFYKPMPTPAVLAAERSWLGRVYLDWSSWPVVSDDGPGTPMHPLPGALPPATSPTATPEWTAISFHDLRFMYDTSLMRGRNNPPLSGTVYVDASGHVEQMEFGGYPQR